MPRWSGQRTPTNRARGSARLAAAAGGWAHVLPWPVHCTWVGSDMSVFPGCAWLANSFFSGQRGENLHVSGHVKSVPRDARWTFGRPRGPALGDAYLGHAGQRTRRHGPLRSAVRVPVGPNVLSSQVGPSREKELWRSLQTS